MSAPTLTSLLNVRNVLLVLSGKGGVGKSTVTCQLAHSLADRGFSVGVLDIDLCGPSVPGIFGVEGRDVINTEKGWAPVQVSDRLWCMSIGFVLRTNTDAVVWRGPRKDAFIAQLLTDVDWGSCSRVDASGATVSGLDFLIVDTPPGTSDEHLTIITLLLSAKSLAPMSAVVVTTPQQVAVDDVTKEINMLRRLSFPAMGIIANMAAFACGSCGTPTPLFGTGAVQSLAERFEIPLIATMPVDPAVAAAEDEGVPALPSASDATKAAYVAVADAVCAHFGV